MSTYGEVPKGDALIAQFLARRECEFTFELHPEFWGIPEVSDYYRGRVWQEVRFTDPPATAIPSESGIYMFVVAPHCGSLKDHSYIFYVGKTDDLKRRYSEYLLEQRGLGPNPREKVVRFLHLLRDHVVFHFTLIPDSELLHAEKLLKDNLTPPANSQLDVIGRLETGTSA